MTLVIGSDLDGKLFEGLRDRLAFLCPRVPDTLERNLHAFLRVEDLNKYVLDLFYHVQAIGLVFENFEQLIQKHMVQPVFDDALVCQLDKSFLKRITRVRIRNLSTIFSP